MNKMKLLNRYAKLSVIIIIFCGLLIGCGFKSALYLPSKTSNNNMSTTSDNASKDSVNINSNSDNNIYNNDDIN